MGERERNFTISVFDHMPVQMRQLQIRLPQQLHMIMTTGIQRKTFAPWPWHIMIYILLPCTTWSRYLWMSAIQEGGTSCLESSRNALSTEQELEPCWWMTVNPIWLTLRCCRCASRDAAALLTFHVMLWQWLSVFTSVMLFSRNAFIKFKGTNLRFSVVKWVFSYISFDWFR